LAYITKFKAKDIGFVVNAKDLHFPHGKAKGTVAKGLFKDFYRLDVSLLTTLFYVKKIPVSPFI